MQPRLNDSQFHHSFHYRVRSHECDRQGVVHNAKYLEILEIARIEFCRDVLHIPIDPWSFVRHHKFFFVRNAIDYFSPAMFDEEMTIWTRVSKIGRTSVTMEQIVNSPRDGRRMIECEAVMVSVDPDTNMPIELTEDLKARVRAQDGYDDIPPIAT
jgi:acyl-CoA thioester hydrolase